jgi:hypothetical protein
MMATAVRSWNVCGATLAGTVMRTKPFWALAVISWPSLPRMGHLVAVGSHVGLVENHATGFSLGAILAVVGLMTGVVVENVR